MSYIPIVGPTGGVKNRLNATNFVKDEKFFTLYVRALSQSASLISLHLNTDAPFLRVAEVIQDRGQEEFTSYFQLAGIHGLPFTHWAKKQDNFATYKSGYCTHGNVLFPTWHRTYVSTLEV